jgi:predicted flap endonuclease-1-like 5' DNA nuclease
MIIDNKEWKIINQEVRMKKGKLVNIKISEGRYVKMYEADAIDQGLLKAKPQAPNKMRMPVDNKTDPKPMPEEKPPADDFASIPGIGKATARALISHGITTFEQLKAVGNLDYLTDKTMQAIEAWRNV